MLLQPPVNWNATMLILMILFRTSRNKILKDFKARRRYFNFRTIAEVRLDFRASKFRHRIRFQIQCAAQIFRTKLAKSDAIKTDHVAGATVSVCGNVCATPCFITRQITGTRWSWRRYKAEPTNATVSKSLPRYCSTARLFISVPPSHTLSILFFFLSRQTQGPLAARIGRLIYLKDYSTCTPRVEPEEFSASPAVKTAFFSSLAPYDL